MATEAHHPAGEYPSVSPGGGGADDPCGPSASGEYSPAPPGAEAEGVGAPVVEERKSLRLAAVAAKQPARELDPALGRLRGRTVRQVNVKLGAPDFESLKALAIVRDVPPSTMARMLLRRAIGEAAEAGGVGGGG